MAKMKVVGGTDIDRSYAFRPSSLEQVRIQVWFHRVPTTKFSWRRLRFVEAVHITEVWSDECGDFEPGNCWTEIVNS